MKPEAPEIIRASWPAPDHVQAFTTTRMGGVSEGVYKNFNLALHTKDKPEAVNKNHQLLMDSFGLPSQPAWLQQMHGRCVVQAEQVNITEADGVWTAQVGSVCAVLTADCLPVFFCDKAGAKVALAHAGWRGLLAGIISAALSAMDTAPEDLLVWFGPAIGPGAFEVGEEVLQQFIAKHTDYEQVFSQKDKEHWLCDLYQLARIELQQNGIAQMYGGGYCTLSEPHRFYSFRRDGQTGRMASLIWLEP